MKMNSKHIIAVSIAVMMAASAFVVFGNWGGADHDDDAVIGADHSVAISQTMTVSTIRTDIQNKINAAVSGDTITVTGSKTNVDATLNLIIDTGKTVVWKAVFTGDDSGKVIIYLSGSGTFEVAAGAKISGNGSDTVDAGGDNVKVVVSGGEVINTGSGDAIHGGYKGIFVNGGLVRASAGDGCATLYGGNGDVTVTGGKVEAVGYATVAIEGYGTVTVTGGTITASGGSSVAILAYDCDIVITGGTVNAKGGGGVALKLFGDEELSTAAITGGTVKASGTDGIAIYMNYGVAAYLSGTLSGGVFVQWDSGAVFKVGKLNIPDSWDATNESITHVAGDWYTGIGKAIWYLDGDEMYLNIGDGDYYFLWEGDGAPSDGIPMMLILGIVVVAALIAVGAFFFFKMKK